MNREVSKTEPLRLLVVDDEPAILSALESYLNLQGYQVKAAPDGKQALELFACHHPQIVISDLKLPDIGGDQLLSAMKKIDEDVQIIIITGFATIQSAISTLKAGAFDYIIKPFRLEAVSHAVTKAGEHLDLLLANRQLQENSLHVLEAMVNTLEQRDFYIAGHSRRVTAWGDALAVEIGLAARECRLIHLSGLIHDIGKIGIDDDILRKPARLTPEEYDIIKSHPERGIRIIEPLQFLQETVPIILHHHERFDGAGYPAGLAGEGIPLGARILAIADTFDAMTSCRAYRKALSAQTAFDELKRCRGSQFDPELVEAFFRVNPRIESPNA